MLMIFVTVALLVGGAVLLALGLINDSRAYIYGSIGCAALAAVALVLSSRLLRRRYERAVAATVTVGGPSKASGTPAARSPAPSGVTIVAPEPVAPEAQGEPATTTNGQADDGKLPADSLPADSLHGSPAGAS
ncbi:MAG: hypothetical protein M0Z42_25475, partial [Actinomycetota bacterium]|nr:hypothetical protein [Actinomycetota bacterium]